MSHVKLDKTDLDYKVVIATRSYFQSVLISLHALILLLLFKYRCPTHYEAYIWSTISPGSRLDSPRQGGVEELLL